MKFINKLTKNQEKELLNVLGFDKYFNSFRYYVEKYNNGESIVYHIYDHNYSSSKDFDDEYLTINDFNIYYDYGYIDQEKNKVLTKELHKFMAKTFGKKYTAELIEKLNKEKEKYQEEINIKINDIDKQIKEIEEM